MNNGLRSPAGSGLFEAIKAKIQSCIDLIDSTQFRDCRRPLVQAKLQVRKSRNDNQTPTEDYLNDIYVIRRYVDFFEAYARYWELVIDDDFARSWDALQDCLDYLRLVKRFSNINVAFFEEQLVEAERLYPYRIFASIGATVGYYECSLCGRDIDSDDCPHRLGHLYSGKLATGFARDLRQFDHIAFVTNPANKRCVVTISNSSKQFELAAYFSALLKRGSISPLSFKRLRFSKIRKANPLWINLPRNQLCYCGSAKKFKRCCISKKYIETDHVDVLYRDQPGNPLQ